MIVTHSPCLKIFKYDHTLKLGGYIQYQNLLLNIISPVPAPTAWRCKSYPTFPLLKLTQVFAAFVTQNVDRSHITKILNLTT